MAVDASLRGEMLASVQSLRAFAISFTNNPDRADDLVQGTTVWAWAKIDQFQRAANLQA